MSLYGLLYVLLGLSPCCAELLRSLDGKIVFRGVLDGVEHGFAVDAVKAEVLGNRIDKLLGRGVGHDSGHGLGDLEVGDAESEIIILLFEQFLADKHADHVLGELVVVDVVVVV